MQVSDLARLIRVRNPGQTRVVADESGLPMDSDSIRKRLESRTIPQFSVGKKAKSAPRRAKMASLAHALPTRNVAPVLQLLETQIVKEPADILELTPRMIVGGKA